MTDRTSLRSALTAASLYLALRPALALAGPPTFQPTYVDMHTESTSDETTNGVTTVKEDFQSSTSAGYSAFTASSGIAGPDGGIAVSAAGHRVQIGQYGIVGGFAASASGEGVPDSSTVVGSRGVNEGEIRFTLSQDASVNIVLHMSIDASGQSFFSGGQGLSRVVMTGTRPDGTTFTFSRLILEDPFENPVILDNDRVYEVKANTEVTLTYTMNAFAGVVFDENHYADTLCVFTVSVLDESGEPIDVDQDGIPDQWEEEGVDVDGDGTIDIDLPAIVSEYGSGSSGVGSGRKTLFVELDAHAGVPFDQEAIDMVKQAFLDAPVLNGDGSTGIDLIVLTDETDLTNAEYNGTTWPQAFDDQKDLRFGTAALRAMPNWETEIEPAYRQIFRYGMWGQTMYRDEVDNLGNPYKAYFSGKAERPGNDFYVSAGEVMSWYTDPTMRTQALAGTLMHEFGHTLGLKHGGQDNDNYKPNYFSVMNYTFQMPLTNSASGGRPLADAWFLDYAASAAKTLDETTLLEDEGLDGPVGMLTVFNFATDGNAPTLQLVDADAAQIDWDNSGTIDTEPTSVDVNRFSGLEDSLQTALKSYSDWDKLWYQLSGDDQFDDGVHTGAENVEPFTFEQFTRLNTLPVIDFSTPNCPADLNGDGIADQGDIQAFVALFLEEDTAVDLNGDGIVDLGDIQTFVTLFLEGC